ncbi:hypothetical protein E3Q01_00911 [Wallemia mellicola]|uniref:Anaphase-promoting complex subunit 5 n=1 Tax=Wallemia mellicola TaxID=1708541 RepID=A0A4T0TTF5_9BASI|nr:hypothetical protein E3Q05_03054 [Wallemia mellicola]TIC68507.1 hypothetical protein E3Q01_00911 [Wallemia mellicola]
MELIKLILIYLIKKNDKNNLNLLNFITKLILQNDKVDLSWREYLAQLGDLDADIYYEFLDFPNKLTSISEFDDFYASLELLIQPSQDGFYDSQQIDPFSLFGLFVRQSLMLKNNLSFKGNLELFEAFLDYVNNKSPSIPKLSSNSNNNDDDYDEILQNKVKTFDNFLTSNNLGDIHKGNENLRKFFDYRSTNFNDVVGIGSHQHALLSLASFYYSNNLIEESSRLLNEAIIISRISKDLETLEKSIKLRRLLGNKKTCVDIYKSSTEDLTIMDELNDIKLSLNQVGVIVLLMAALSDYFKGDKLSDLFIRSTRALIRLEENTVQDKVDASLQTWSTINAILWDMAGVKSIRDIYQDLSLKGETWHTSAQLTCRINIAHQYSQNGEYASALDCLFNQKLLSEINLSDYTIWANAIWSVLKQRSDRLDRQWTGPDVESSNDQEMVNKIESLIGNAVENDGNRDLTLEQLLLSYKMADDRQYLKLKLKAQLELAGFETRYNYGVNMSSNEDDLLARALNSSDNQIEARACVIYAEKAINDGSLKLAKDLLLRAQGVYEKLEDITSQSDCIYSLIGVLENLSEDVNNWVERLLDLENMDIKQNDLIEKKVRSLVQHWGIIISLRA